MHICLDVANVVLALQRVVESDEYRMKADSGGRSDSSTPSPPPPASRSQARPPAPAPRRSSIDVEENGTRPD